MNNSAIVIRVHKLEPIEGMDRIQLVKLFGTQVIVGKDVNIGDILVYVDSNMVMSHEFLSHNNLYRNSTLNKDQFKSGYFDDNGRVKCIKMRGTISDGFLFPLEYLYNAFTTDVGKFPIGFNSVGYEFNDLGGFNVCSKYIPKVKNTHSQNKSSIKKLEVPMFVEHWDTEQFMKNKHKIPAGTICYIEEKVHGTSHRTGYVRLDIWNNKSWIYKFLYKLANGFSVIPHVSEWIYLNGTRRVIHVPNKKINPYVDNTIREIILSQLNGQLHKGEQLYMELFGYEKTGSMIQKGFPYGCEQGSFRKLLYRITMNNEDGKTVDYNREYVYNKAEELGLEKPYLFEKFYYSGTKRSMEILEEKVIEYAQGQSELAKDTLKEGVVIWFIGKDGLWTNLKYKSDAFRLFESNSKDKGEIDQEDIN